jgi:hypothetical protein
LAISFVRWASLFAAGLFRVDFVLMEFFSVLGFMSCKGG